MCKDLPTANMTTTDFAKLILARPHIVHSFLLSDVWYSIVSINLLEHQLVLIKREDFIVANPTVFCLHKYLPDDYCEANGISQPAECVDEMVRNLLDFNKTGEETWVVRLNDLDRIIIQCKKIA